jgi:hypothetical protein
MFIIFYCYFYYYYFFKQIVFGASSQIIKNFLKKSEDLC